MPPFTWQAWKRRLSSIRPLLAVQINEWWVFTVDHEFDVYFVHEIVSDAAFTSVSAFVAGLYVRYVQLLRPTFICHVTSAAHKSKLHLLRFVVDLLHSKSNNKPYNLLTRQDISDLLWAFDSFVELLYNLWISRMLSIGYNTMRYDTICYRFCTTRCTARCTIFSLVRF